MNNFDQHNEKASGKQNTFCTKVLLLLYEPHTPTYN